MSLKLPVVSIFALLLCSCIPGLQDESSGGTPSEIPKQEDNVKDLQPNAPARETANVSYSGIVRPTGISIYQQGTHRLVLDNGRFVLLESDTVDLNGYVGEQVEAFGAVRPTVEEGGMIMRVERVSLQMDGNTSEPTAEVLDDVVMDEEDAPPSSTGDVLEVPEVEEDIPEEEPIPEEPVDPSMEEEVAEVVEESDSSSSEAEEEEVEEVEEIPALTGDAAQQVESMLADDYAPERWTQSYCTSHIGFCMPVHKNWWFKSFGNTSSHLWHVEMANAPVESLGDGIIVVNVEDKALDEVGVTNKTVRTEGDRVVGYRVWNDNTHFEISAPAGLDDPVKYMVQHITEHE